MKALISEYGYIAITIVTVIVGFMFFTWLTENYSTMEVNFISGMTGVEVEDVVRAQKSIE